MRPVKSSFHRGIACKKGTLSPVFILLLGPIQFNFFFFWCSLAVYNDATGSKWKGVHHMHMPEGFDLTWGRHWAHYYQKTVGGE